MFSRPFYPIFPGLICLIRLLDLTFKPDRRGSLRLFQNLRWRDFCNLQFYAVLTGASLYPIMPEVFHICDAHLALIKRKWVFLLINTNALLPLTMRTSCTILRFKRYRICFCVGVNALERYLYDTIISTLQLNLIYKNVF